MTWVSRSSTQGPDKPISHLEDGRGAGGGCKPAIPRLIELETRHFVDSGQCPSLKWGQVVSISDPRLLLLVRINLISSFTTVVVKP